MKYTTKKKVCILTQSHLCRNPRVLKEAKLLAQNNYRVTILNSTHSKLLTLEDESLIKGCNITLISAASLDHKNLRAFIHRILNKAGQLMVKSFGIQTPLAMGYAPLALKKLALMQNADLYICHQELGLYCGVNLLKHGKNTAFDFEDWYSEDLAADARNYRPLKLLKSLEKYALQNAAFCVTTSDALAGKLASYYHSAIPATIYNTFDADENVLSQPKIFNRPLKLFWFSQTIGADRGLEQFFDLINAIDITLEIHLLGNTSDTYKASLEVLQGKHHLFFHRIVSPDQLAKKIAGFDIGLALELHQPISRELTVTNKLFQYMLSGLPIIATNTAGQQEIISRYGGALLIDFDDTDRSANNLRALFDNPMLLQLLQSQAVSTAKELNWQNEKIKLLNIIKLSLN
jgi:glycosyltransferase involved in cell wall biosynthesis